MSKAGVTRRDVLQRALWLAASAFAAPLLSAKRAAPRFGSYPFTLGVASGSPRSDGAVLWTRLLPEGLEPAAEDLELRFQVAHDERFQQLVREGSATALATQGHAVHVELRGLQPERDYFYRFLAGGEASPVGRTRTAPARDASPSRLRFAFASCQNYQHGFFAAHRHLADERPDLVVFLGDYIYEHASSDSSVRRHTGDAPRTLAQYRERHAQYRLDPDLQRAHAAAPWIVTWDDHEVENDYAGDQSEHLDPSFLTRRAAAYRAYFEHLPLRPAQQPKGASLRLFDRFDFGRLACFHVLDDRQYRARQACPPAGRGGSGTVGADCDERLRPERSLLGFEQERWLDASLGDSSARWNILAQQSVMAEVDRKPGPGEEFWTDGWDGYPAARRRLLEAVARRRPANPLVIGGDVHSTWVTHLRTEPRDQRAPVLASEVCGTSISSNGPPQARVDAVRAENPHVLFANGDRRGYVSVELTEARALVSIRALDDVTRRETGVSTLASFVVENGQPIVRA